MFLMRPLIKAIVKQIFQLGKITEIRKAVTHNLRVYPRDIILLRPLDVMGQCAYG
jgi:hypothetical protein